MILSIVAFIVAIGILVTVHEFGHYWVAKTLGVKVLRFSIGFGKPLWLTRYGRDRTEFCISAIPLGGYVKMLDENEGDVAAEDVHRAFNRQSLPVRAAVVFAGPFFNFLFAIVAYTLVYVIGLSGLKPIVGEVIADSKAAHAGLIADQEIIAVNDYSIQRWDGVMEFTLNQIMANQPVEYTVRDQQGQQSKILLDLTGISLDDVAEGDLLDKLGIVPFRPQLPPIVGQLTPEGPAERGGLQVNDEVIAVDGQPIDSWYDWADYIQQHPNQAITMSVKRDQQTVQLTITPDSVDGKGQIGIYAPESYPIPERYLSNETYALGAAFLKGVERTWDTSLLTIRMIGEMITLHVSPKHIGGPVTIAQYAGKSAEKGIVVFLLFLSLISISLGVLNLLPVPMLDGGHLAMYAIEGIKGSPLTDTTQLVLQKIGLALLLCLMTLALFNDVGRLLNFH